MIKRFFLFISHLLYRDHPDENDLPIVISTRVIRSYTVKENPNEKGGLGEHNRKG